MQQIALVAATPLLLQGLAAALHDAARWRLTPQVMLQVTQQVALRTADAAAPAGPAFDADALVLHQAADAAPPHWLQTLPPNLPAVIVGSALQAFTALPNPLALLPVDATAAQLRAALHAVLQGLNVRDARWSFGATAAGGPRAEPLADHEPLTPRELEVYELLAKGLSNPDIAGVLGISAHTAKFHVGQILAKVGAATRAEAVSAGLRMGIIGL